MRKFSVVIVFLSLVLGLVGTRPFTVYADSDIFDSTNYTLVDYVTPNGNNVAVMLNYTPNYNTVLDGQFYGPYQSNKYIFGSLKSSTNQYAISMIDTKHWRIRYNDGSAYVNTSNNTYFENKIYRIYMTNSSVTFSASGETDVVATYTSSNGSSGSTLALFAQTDGNSFASYANQHRMYDLKIYENSILVHHYYPCIRKSDDVVGIYDSITSTFLQPSGGVLAYGSIATTQYTITTSVTPTGSGTVTGGGTYDNGSVISLSASPNSGYHFVSWSDGNTNNPRSVTVTSNQSFQAMFVQDSSPVNQYTVTTSVTPTGSGNVSGGGVYDEDSVISLTATPNNGYQFDSWSDGNTSNPRSVTVSSNLSFTAQFLLIPEPPTQYTISTSVSPSNSGTVTGGGTYNSGTVVTLTATPSSGYAFGSWSDGSTQNPRQIEVTANASYTAYFTDDYDTSILLGVNTFIYDQDLSHYVEQYSMDLDQGGYNYTITSENISSDSFQSILLQPVFNNEYYGYIVLNGTVKSNNTTMITLSNYKVFVNGSICNIYLKSSTIATHSSLNISITVNTHGLSLKESVNNAIYNGTQDSNESTQNLDDVSDSYSDVSSQVFNLEDQFGSGFNSSMNNVPTNFNFGTQFGNKFLASATWVRNQFDQLTLNNPFGALITYSLILGLALLIVGRRLL